MPDLLSPEEVDEAKGWWAADPDGCRLPAERDGFVVEDEEDWLAYCQWCLDEYGISALGEANDIRHGKQR